ncbi:hypothetical protein [Megasphaera elsdenii]|uniref:hypothetical protein n=1 Tax=Megasphaera elsdenii TaxID=907 RepID=UPI000919B73A|nr:hypothetical protein [Megasphaera elsdenii]SHK02114.1 hypothetical protein SAMN04488492_10568 [Megasphaera elsdenii]
MISDETAKMPVNTIAAYCVLHRNCNNCKIRNNCLGVEGVAEPFSGLRSYSDINIFEKTCQKKAEKPPKFDITLKDSTDFREYINEIFMREAEKAGLPMNTANSIKWSTNGKIKVTFVDNDTTYVGVAKCHPNDAFNPEIGIKLAIERAAQAMHAPFVPEDGEAYYYVDDEDTIYSTINHNTNRDILNIAVGNCFNNYERALSNKDAITKHIERAAELLEKLRDEGEK